MFKRGSITKDMKHYLVNSDVKFDKLQANPTVHKSGIPLRTIVNVGNHPTANMAEIVEHELAENVRSLPSFIQDTTFFLNKLSTINQPLPNNCLMFCIDAQALYPSVPRKKRAKQPKKLSRKDQIKTYQLMKYSE